MLPRSQTRSGHPFAKCIQVRDYDTYISKTGNVTDSAQKYENATSRPQHKCSQQFKVGTSSDEISPRTGYIHYQTANPFSGVKELHFQTMKTSVLSRPLKMSSNRFLKIVLLENQWDILVIS